MSPPYKAAGIYIMTNCQVTRDQSWNAVQMNYDVITSLQSQYTAVYTIMCVCIGMYIVSSYINVCSYCTYYTCTHPLLH